MTQSRGKRGKKRGLFPSHFLISAWWGSSGQHRGRTDVWLSEPQWKRKILSTELRVEENIFNSLPFTERSWQRCPGKGGWGLLKKRPRRESACPRSANVCESVLGCQGLSPVQQLTSETGTRLWKSYRRKVHAGLGREIFHFCHWSGMKFREDFRKEDLLKSLNTLTLNT